ncbi:MAG: DUF4019 domain-containing protein [Spirochaetes bacterium]|nr:DUF4019 domain-containing protein [Spirochaetota bacterium]
MQNRGHAPCRRRRDGGGAPDGAYVVIEFKSQFENKKEAIDIIIL